MTKIVIVSTAAAELKGHPTGLWIEELSSVYYAFKAKGYDIVIASTSGGPIPIDQNSMTEGMFTESAKKFMHDYEAVGALCHSVKLDTIDLADVDCLFMPGGHGTCTDFTGNATLKNAIETMVKADKVVGSVCHGPVCLVDCMAEDGVTPLVKGKSVTGFSDAEEEAVQLQSLVPFLLESKLIDLGAKYSKADSMWSPHVCVDGKLITGQNPGSSEACAEEIIKILG